MAPLKNVQVWRFALYYFFVFGAFVALSLWLPQYLIKVYDVDLKTAGMTAAIFFALAGMQLVMMGLLGELLIRIYFTSSHTTPYVVREVLESSCAASPASG